MGAYKVNKNFYKLFAANFISNFGNMLTYMASALYIYNSESSNYYVALLFAVRIFSKLIILPITIKYSDQWNKKRTLILCDILSAVILLSWSILYLNLWYSYVAVFLTGILSSIHRPIALSYLPEIVEKEKLTKANSLLILSISSNILFGVAVGGILVGTIGFRYTALIDIVTFLISSVILGFMPRFNFSLAKKAMDRSVFSIKQSVVLILESIKNDNVLFLMFFLSILHAISTGTINALEIGYAKEFLNLNDTYTGILISSSGIGFILGSFIMLKMKSNWKIYVVAILAMPIINYIFASSGKFYVCFLCFMTLCMFSAFANIVRNTEYQSRTSKTIMSRLLVFTTTVYECVVILAMLISGVLADYLNSAIIIRTNMIILELLIVVAVIMLAIKKSLVFNSTQEEV